MVQSKISSQYSESMDVFVFADRNIKMHLSLLLDTHSFISNSTFHLSLEFLTKFCKMRR